jgi:LacI family transcriptional regulator
MKRVVVAIDMSQPYSHHFDLYAGIERYARERGDWECVADHFLELRPQSLLGKKCDGMIARATPQMARQMADAAVPLVNVWSGSPAKDVPSVFPDAQACGKMATEHLLLRGYRQFAFQGYVRHGSTQRALVGFKAALREAGCSWTTQLISPHANERPRSWEPYLARMDQWIATWKTPIGVLVIHSGFCRFLATACLRAGLRIPEDVALIGFGNEPLICTHLEPTLSAIDMGFDRVGYEAASLLERLMAGKRAPEAPVLVEPTELIVRRSTDSYAVSHPVVRQALTFIAEHSHEGIRVDDVVRHVGVAVRSLERYFGESLGRTMTEEIARLRLERATRLLVEGDEPIKQVARACGYGDANYFHKVFINAHGVSPREYRRRHRSG